MLEGLEISEVNFKKIDLRDRCDAEYFGKADLQIENRLKKIGAIELRKIGKFVASAFYPAATQLYEVGDVPFIRCVDTINYPLITKEQDHLFEKIPMDFAKNSGGINLLEREDLVITKVGSPCFASIVLEHEIVALSRTVLGIKDISGINRYYLLIFLRCKFGFNQLLRERELTIQYQLTLERVKKTLVFIPSIAFQKEIEILVKEYISKSNLSKQLYSQAENLLLESLGLDNPSPNAKRSTLPQGEGDGTEISSGSSNNRDLITISLREGRFAMQNGEGSSFGVGNLDKADKFSHLSINQKSLKESFLKTGRLDAEYYQPKYEKIINQIQSGEYAKLCDLVLIQKSIEPGSEAYLESGLEFIRVANLSKFGISKSEIFLDEKKYSGIIKPKKDTILLSKDGTVGIAYKASEDLNCITSGAILHLTINQTNILPDYLTLVLNSKLVQMQAERDSGGSIIQHWKPSEIMEILIPIIDQKTQSKISSLIRQSFSLKKTSENLLETSKKAVEMAIEESEEKAIKYLEKTDF